MTTPDDYPRHRPPPEDQPVLHKPGRGPGAVAILFAGALLVLGVMLLIAILVL